MSLGACAEPSPPATENEPGANEPSPEPDSSEQKSQGEPKSESEEKLDCSKLKSTGLKLGDVAPNLELVDGEGKTRQLHEFCNDTVILIASEH